MCVVYGDIAASLSPKRVKGAGIKDKNTGFSPSFNKLSTKQIQEIPAMLEEARRKIKIGKSIH